MPIRNYPFSVIRPGDSARPYLPVTVVNPAVNKEVRVYALIDTGADEYAFLLHLLHCSAIIFKKAN
jgi:hypothetical protein